MHEIGLQRQIAVGTLVHSQQRRALLVPRSNRWSTTGFVPPPVYMGFPLFVLAKRHSGQMFTVPWRARGTVGSQADRIVGTLSCSASPRPAVRHAPCRPDPPVVCPGFGLENYDYVVLLYRHSVMFRMIGIRVIATRNLGSGSIHQMWLVGIRSIFTAGQPLVNRTFCSTTGLQIQKANSRTCLA